MLNKWMEFNVYCSIRSTGLWALISQQDRCCKGPVSRILQLEGDETWTSGGSSGFGKNGWVCGVLRRQNPKNQMTSRTGWVAEVKKNLKWIPTFLVRFWLIGGHERKGNTGAGADLRKLETIQMSNNRGLINMLCTSL